MEPDQISYRVAKRMNQNHSYCLKNCLTGFALALSVQFWTTSAAAQASAGAQEPDLAETVIFIPRPQFLVDAQLETTVYKPSVPGPWPLVVINHGSHGYDNPHFQERNRPIQTARFFLDRGYLVAAPMRQGFSKSTGVYSWNCDHAGYAERYGGDISAVVDYFVKRGDVRGDEILVTGQSNGGMVTLGYAANQPQARGIINFAGGINSNRPYCSWQSGMVSAARALGAKTHIPALWIYTEDDKIFPPSVSKPFFEAYRDAGAAVTFKLYPTGGHPFSTTRFGRETWGPDVEQFLRQLGLPAAPIGMTQQAAK